MKRFLTLILTAALVLGLLAGCGGEEDTPGGENTPDVKDTSDGTDTPGGTDAPGGGDAPDAGTPLTVIQIAAKLAASQTELPELYAVAFGDPEFRPYSMIYLGDGAESCADGVICYPFGVTACEISVFRMDSADTAAACAESLESYRAEREGAFFGYAPEESELAAAGLVLTEGDTAALVICRDPDSARTAWDSCFGPEAAPGPDLYDYVQHMPEPGGDARDTSGDEDGTDIPDDSSEMDDTDTPDDPGKADGTHTPDGGQGETGTSGAPDGQETFASAGENWADDPVFLMADPAVIDAPDGILRYDPFDQEAVAAAFETGGLSSLNPKELYVYRRCREILEEIVTDGMTDVQKEWLVNVYLVRNTRYDPAELSSHPTGIPDPDNDNPYGVLAHGVGICLGYANTFQLFMDILDIPCQTVHGFAHREREDHAWNLVQLEGDWYAVDVTWNDPVFTNADGAVVEPDEAYLRLYAVAYFNVTSDILRGTEHQWDEDVPEAQGTRYAWGGDWQTPEW